jgi:hypothetical protein
MTAETFNGSANFYWITNPGLAACRLTTIVPRALR